MTKEQRINQEIDEFLGFGKTKTLTFSVSIPVKPYVDPDMVDPKDAFDVAAVSLPEAKAVAEARIKAVLRDIPKDMRVQVEFKEFDGDDPATSNAVFYVDVEGPRENVIALSKALKGVVPDVDAAVSRVARLVPQLA